MKTPTFLKLASASAMISLFAGCLQSGKSPNSQAQQKSLEDTLYFTQLSVIGSSAVLRLAREGEPLARVSPTADPIDFPEYITFTKSATGALTLVPAQTQLGLTVDSKSPPKCSDAACTSLTITLKRPGGTLADSTMIRATRIPTSNCGLSITESSGATNSFNPVFTDATLTTTLIATGSSTSASDRYAFYGKATWTSAQTGYLTTLYVRNFVGAPSNLWVDEIDSSVSTSGSVSRASATARTFTADSLLVGASSLDLFANDADGRRVIFGCTTPNPIP